MFIKTDKVYLTITILYLSIVYSSSPCTTSYAALYPSRLKPIANTQILKLKGDVYKFDKLDNKLYIINEQFIYDLISKFWFYQKKIDKNLAAPYMYNKNIFWTKIL